MGDFFYNYDAGRVEASAVGTNAGVTATLSAVTGKAITVVGIQCSGDAAAIVTIESPAASVLWRKRFAAAFTMSENFEPGEIVGVKGQALLVKVSASTTNSEANIEGMVLSV